MKKLLFLGLSALLIASLSNTAPAAEAYTQTPGICKAQCITWYYYWGNDGTLEFVMDECSMGGWDSLKTVAKLGKDAATGSTGTALGIVQDAIVCAITINAAIAPVFESCESVCATDKYAYGPDIAITELRYDENAGELVIEVTNGGNAYTNDIEVDVYAASTTSRDCKVTYGEMLTYYMIPELSPSGARYFEEGLSSTYTKRIPWTAPEGKCSKVKVIVDPEEELPERYFESWGEANNVREEWINDLPVLPYYDIENLDYKQNGDSDDMEISFKVKNNGEVMGWPGVTVRTCDGKKGLAYEETVSVEPGQMTYQSFQLDDLFDGTYHNEKLLCIRVTVEDENDKAEQTILIQLYSGTVEGTVYDMYGKPVGDATVTIDTGQTDKTDSDGKYKIIGVTRMGTHTLTATSTKHEFDGTANVTFSVNASASSQENLHITGVDIVLMDYPGSVTITCPVSEYAFRMDSGFFNYRGGAQDRTTTLTGVVPGNYTLMISKNGYTTAVQNIIVTGRDEIVVQCGIEPMQSYGDDSGIIFGPQQNDLWTQPLGEGYHLNYVRISGDGSTVAVLAASSAGDENPMKLLVFTQGGQKLADFVFPYIRFDSERGPLYPSMRISYDGSYILIGNRYIYSKTGALISENPEGSVHQDADLSSDGAFVCKGGTLYSSSFTELAQDLITGAGTDEIRCQSSHNNDDAFYTLDGSSLGNCREYGVKGICRSRFGIESQIDTLDGNNPHCVAESDSGNVVVVSLPESGEQGSLIYYIQNGVRTWKKVMPTIDPHSGFGSILFSRISVTPAGGYIAALSGPKGYTYDLFVYDSQGNDLLNVPMQDTVEWSHFYDARATGTGIYYVLSRGESEVTFGVLGQPGQAQKQQMDTGGQELPEWEVGTSGNNDLAILGLAGGVLAFILGFGAWKAGMLK